MKLSEGLYFISVCPSASSLLTWEQYLIILSASARMKHICYKDASFNPEQDKHSVACGRDLSQTEKISVHIMPYLIAIYITHPFICKSLNFGITLHGYKVWFLLEQELKLLCASVSSPVKWG